MALVLRKAQCNRRGPPEWEEHDFDVMWEGRAVGRIYRRSSAGDDAEWLWSILIIEPRITTKGLAGTLDEAKAAFAENWHKWLASAGLNEDPAAG